MQSFQPQPCENPGSTHTCSIPHRTAAVGEGQLIWN